MSSPLQALRALGEVVDGYGRVLVPKILRAFPPEFCRWWIVHVKRQGLSEGSISRLMEFLSEEVDGALIAQKIRGESTDPPHYTPSAVALHVSSKQPRSVISHAGKHPKQQVMEETVDHVRESLSRSPRKSIREAS